MFKREASENEHRLRVYAATSAIPTPGYDVSASTRSQRMPSAAGQWHTVSKEDVGLNSRTEVYSTSVRNQSDMTTPALLTEDDLTAALGGGAQGFRRVQVEENASSAYSAIGTALLRRHGVARMRRKDLGSRCIGVQEHATFSPPALSCKNLGQRSGAQAQSSSSLTSRRKTSNNGMSFLRQLSAGVGVRYKQKTC